jgi:hypothetical protein
VSSSKADEEAAPDCSEAKAVVAVDFSAAIATCLHRRLFQFDADVSVATW